jgi:hypothetical protein
MRGSSVAYACRSALPIGAFLALATLATLFAAQAQIACTRRISVAMPDMPGMDMSGGPTGGALSLCPIVVMLSAAATILTLNAFALLLTSRNRGAVSRGLALFVMRLPFAGACATTLAFGAGAVGTMMALDGTAPDGAIGWLCLGAIILASGVAATLVAFGIGRFVLAITRRIVIALEREIQISRSADAHVRRRIGAAPPARRVPLLAAYRGLRAPPQTVR